MGRNLEEEKVTGSSKRLKFLMHLWISKKLFSTNFEFSSLTSPLSPPN